ncbi:MAG: O-antigen ligase family protein [Bacillota bacterium]
MRSAGGLTYIFVASVFIGDLLVFRGLWTYGVQGIYHCTVILFLIMLVVTKRKIPPENLKLFLKFLVCYYFLLLVVLINSLPYSDHTNLYKRNITFTFLMFSSTFPMIIVNKNLIPERHVNRLLFTGGAAAFITAIFVLTLRFIEVNNISSVFYFQLDTIPAAFHLRQKKWQTDISETRLLFMNVKYVIYNQIGIRMVWGYIFVSSFCSESIRASAIKKAFQLILLVFTVISGSRESWLMLLIFLFLKAKRRNKIIFSAMVPAAIYIIWLNMSGIYFSEMLKDVPVLSRLNILFEFPETLQKTRIGLWQNSIELIKINPFLGIGPHGFIFYSPGLFTDTVYNADNSILGLTAAFGIAGLIILMLTVYRTVKSVIKQFRENENKVIKTLSSGCISYIITALIAPHFMWPYSNLDTIFWLAVSLIVLLVNNKGETVTYAA